MVLALLMGVLASPREEVLLDTHWLGLRYDELLCTAEGVANNDVGAEMPVVTVALWAPVVVGITLRVADVDTEDVPAGV